MAVSLSTVILESQKIKSLCFHFSPPESNLTHQSSEGRRDWFWRGHSTHPLLTLCHFPVSFNCKFTLCSEEEALGRKGNWVRGHWRGWMSFPAYTCSVRCSLGCLEFSPPQPQQLLRQTAVSPPALPCRAPDLPSILVSEEAAGETGTTLCGNKQTASPPQIRSSHNSASERKGFVFQWCPTWKVAGMAYLFKKISWCTFFGNVFIYLAASGLGYSMWDLLAVAYKLDLSKPREIVEDREAWRAADHGVAKSRTQLHDWATTATCKPLVVACRI